MGHLTLGELASLAISDQTDANGVFIVMWAAFTDDVGAGQLVVPAIPSMYFTVSKTIPIAQDEVIPQALVPKAQMLAMNGLGRPEWFAEMMDHDSCPSGPIQIHSEIKDRITTIGTLIEFRQIGQWKSTGGHRTAIEAEQTDGQSHCRSKTGPDDLGPTSDRRLLSSCRVNGCHGRLVVQRKAALLQTFLSSGWGLGLEPQDGVEGVLGR